MLVGGHRRSPIEQVGDEVYALMLALLASHILGFFETV